MEYTVRELNLIWLDCFDFMTYSKKTQMIKAYGIDRDIRKSLPKDMIPALQDFLTQQELNKLNSCADDEFLQDVLKKYQDKNVVLVTIYSTQYPALLRETDNPPYILYCKGNVDLLSTRCIAIVGTRRPSDYGRVVTKSYAKALAEAGLTIVSGLANGVDTIAHEEAISAGGKTIAVLAGGFDHIYPASNYALSEEIASDHLLVCESRPEVQPMNYMFPIRNRILAGLSEAVLITEAQENSGSLHTKNYAVDYGRDLYVVPGKITSLESKGCNKILKEMQGAITLDPSDVLEAMHIVKQENTENNNFQLDFNESNILRYTMSDKKSYQAIMDYTGLAPQQLNAILLSLQIRGLIEKLPGNFYLSN